MINEDDVLTSSGLFDASSLSKYLLNDNNNDTDSVGRSYSSPLYNSNYTMDEEDPWGSIETFHPFTDLGQNLASISNPSGPIVTTAVDSDTVTEGITAASVLVGVYLPEIYNTAYIWTNPAGDRVELDSWKRVLHLTGLSSRILAKIIALVAPPNTAYVTRNEFNTGLALTAFAQKNMELSLLNVYQHKNDLPVPILSGLNSQDVMRNKSSTLVTKDKRPSTVVDDPWRTITPTPSVEHMDSLTDGTPIIQDNGAAKRQQQHTSMDSIVQSNSHNGISSVDTAGPSLSEPKTTIKMDIGDWYTNIDNIKVTVASEKEGFLFKHFNYILENQAGTSLVVRRYSDFYWLWEVLLQRYPCRLVPIIPPKKISGRSDDSFVETRRQGLARFINDIARHPVLRKDTYFDTFMTEPSEFSVWRRANSPNLDEEFIRVNAELIPDALLACIPRDLDDRLERMEKTLHQRMDHYLLLYHGMETMAQVARAQNAELERYGSTLSDMSLVERQCFISGCQACGHMVTRGFDSVANYMRKAGSILDLEANDTVSGVMDRLKQQYDTLMAFKDVLERRKKLQVHQMDGLLKRISSNKAKANQNRGVPGLEHDVEALDAAIQTDQEQFTFQQRRALFIRYCLTSELALVHKQQAFVSVLYQNYVSEKVHYARQKMDNWKALEALTCSMPELDDFE